MVLKKNKMELFGGRKSNEAEFHAPVCILKGREQEEGSAAAQAERSEEDVRRTGNPFRRLTEWFFAIPRNIRRLIHERRMRKLKLGTVCFKDGMLQTIDVSWDIHWMANVYLAAIIRDYLRFFIRNTAVVGNYVYEHNPEGYTDYWEAEEKLDQDEMFRRWEKVVNDTADLFDDLVKSVDSEESGEQFQKKVNVAFDALKEIFCDLEW